MEDKLSIATSILTRAVVLDNGERLTEALVCYQEGIEILLKAVKGLPDGDLKKKAFRTKTEEYMKRAEVVKEKLERLKATGTYREQIQVAEDAVGFSYATVFSRFMDEDVNKVEVDDPYIRSAHQCDNFLRLLELCVRLCPKLKSVSLVTGKDVNNFKDQLKRLNMMRDSLQNIPGRSGPVVSLAIEFSESLHDREIRFDNGWVVKIGRGLDYFKPVDRFSLGWTDFDLRICKATTIDVFHRKELQRIR